jgi:hypothetical protein
MKVFIGALLLAAPSVLSAQEAAPAAPTAPAEPVAPAPVMRQIILPPNTEVVVTPNDSLTTKGKKIKEGYKFPIATVFDVMQDGFVMIPKGTVGEGTVTYVTNKGAFGKSGKMEVSFDRLVLNGQKIPLTGNFRQEGEGNTGATVGAAVAVGVFSAFVTGRSAIIVNGTQLRARTVEPLAFAVPDNAPRFVAATMVPAAATPVAPITAVVQPVVVAAAAAQATSAAPPLADTVGVVHAAH